MKNIYKLSEKTAMIVGPVTRLTSAIAMKLADHGADVGIVDLTSKAAENIAQVIQNLREVNPVGGRAVGVGIDLTKPSNLSEAVRKVTEHFGAIDIYIDAMTLAGQHLVEKELSSDYVDRILNFQMRTPIILTHEILKFMKGRRNTRVVYLLSDVVAHGLPGDGLIASTRQGLEQHAASLATEVRPQTMTVNCVAVGPTEEFLLQHFPESKTIGEAQKQLNQKMPFAKLVDANEVAEVVTFLASGLSSAISGQTIRAAL